MGHVSPHEALLLRWAELCADPRWDDFGGKIELNALGVIEMSPASNRHGMKQAAVGFALRQQLPAGTVIIECCIATPEGVRVPDVAWASADFMALHGDLSPFPQAPEICVEVRSPTNTDAEMAFKTRLYLDAGAVEVWVIDENGVWHVFGADGPRGDTRFAVRMDTGPQAPGA